MVLTNYSEHLYNCIYLIHFKPVFLKQPDLLKIKTGAIRVSKLQ